MAQVLFDNEEKAMNDLSLKLIQQLSMSDGFDVKAKEIVDAIPPVSRDAYFNGTDSIWVAAANYYDTWYKVFGPKTADGGNVVVTQPTGGEATTRVKKEYIVPDLDDKSAKMIREIAQGSMDEMAKRMAATSITAILVENPKPSEMYKGITVIPECTQEQLDKYEKNLVPTAENKAAFEKIKAAIGKTPMPVYCNDAQRKFQGVIIETTPDNEGGSKKTSVVKQSLTITGLNNFLLFKVLGRIGSAGTGIGVELLDIQPETKGSAKADKTVKQGKPKLRWVGKADALKEGKDSVVISLNEYKKDGKEREVTTGTLKIEEYFEVYQLDKNGKIATSKNGKEKVRKVHLTGKTTQMPVLVRKADFKEIFGEATDKTVISVTLTEDDKAKFLERQQDYIAAAANSELTNVTGSEMTDIVNKLAQAREASANAAAGEF